MIYITITGYHSLYSTNSNFKFQVHLPLKDQTDHYHIRCITLYVYRLLPDAVISQLTLQLLYLGLRRDHTECVQNLFFVGLFLSFKKL